MKQIQLTQGQVALVDDEDFERISKFKWYAHFRKCGDVYAVRTTRRPRRAMIYMHREILGAPSEFLVDHVSGNTLDNSRKNLRLASPSQNLCNQRPRQRYLNKPTSSNLKGVSWHKRLKCWQVRIGCKGSRHFVGQFQNEIDAAKAYDRAAVANYGEFAKTNYKEVG